MILTVGSYGAGISINVSRIPERGETIGGGSLRIGHGGKTSNQAVAAARQGAKVSILTALGNDQFAANAKKMWSHEGIEFESVLQVDNSQTMAGVIIVGDDGENSIAIAEGALNELSEEFIFSKKALFAKADVVVISYEIPRSVIEASIQLAAKLGKTVIVNPAPYKEIDREILSLASYVIPNETEYLALQEQGFEVNAEQTLVVTRGSEGVQIKTQEGTQEFNSHCSAMVVDSTGAGDTFVGTFAAALDEGFELSDAVTRAVIAAGITVTRPEVVPAIPSRDEVNKGVKEYGRKSA